MVNAVAAAVIMLCAVAACSGGADAALPVRDPVRAADVAQLARSVAAALMASDFEEPRGERLVLSERGDLLYVKGVINRASHRRVRKALRNAPDVDVVVLTHVPGSADDMTNLALGRMLRAARYTTYLPAGALVASGGTDLFLAGAARIVERGAQVGVHSWDGDSGTAGDALPRDALDHTLYLDYYRDIGIDEGFYWFTLQAAPPDGMHWMTENEMARYAVHTHLR